MLSLFILHFGRFKHRMLSLVILKFERLEHHMLCSTTSAFHLMSPPKKG
jgi:hypothetical protein